MPIDKANYITMVFISIFKQGGGKKWALKYQR